MSSCRAISTVILLLLSIPAGGQKKSNVATLGLRAEIAPVLQLHSQSAVLTEGGVRSIIRNTSNSSVAIESRIQGNGLKQRIQIPLAVISNCRSFLFKATAESEETGSSIQLLSNKNGSLISRSFPLSANTYFAMALDQPAHILSEQLAAIVEIEFEAIPPGQTRESRISLQLVNQR